MTSSKSPAELSGVGVSLRPELCTALFDHGDDVGFVEVIAESLGHKPSWQLARTVGQTFPLALHGIKLSLGSPEGVDVKRAASLARHRDRLGAVVVSEHLAFVRSGDVEIGHLTPLPFSRAAVDVVAHNVARVRSMLPDLLLENVASPFRRSIAADDCDEADFLRFVVEATGSRLLFDVANFWANAQNRGLDAMALLDRLPLSAIAQVHIAGSRVDATGFVEDTHAHAIPDDVFAFTAALLQRTGPVPVLLERDRGFGDDDVSALFSDVKRLGQLQRSVAGLAPASPPKNRAVTLPPPQHGAAGALQQRVAATAEALVATDGSVDFIDDVDLARARSILVHKRAEECLWLLPRLRGQRGIDAVAVTALRGHRRQAHALVDDARVVCAAARLVPGLVAAAAADGATLAVRFNAGHDASPRRGPAWAVDDGVVAVKLPGFAARTWSRPARRPVPSPAPDPRTTP